MASSSPHDAIRSAIHRLEVLFVEARPNVPSAAALNKAVGDLERLVRQLPSAPNAAASQPKGKP